MTANEHTRWDRPVLHGTTASRGLIRGIAHVMSEATPLRSFRTGEILICPALSDRVMDLAEQAAGVVADVGGPLSHGATRMRELGHPTVVGVGNATTCVADGDVIELDADQGIVRLIITEAP